VSPPSAAAASRAAPASIAETVAHGLDTTDARRPGSRYNAARQCRRGGHLSFAASLA